MEAFLLNPGNATAKSIAPSSGQATSGEGSTDFSPVMEDAIQSVESQSGSDSSKQSPSDGSQQLPLSSDTRQTDASPQADSSMEPVHTGNILTGTIHSEMNAFFTTQQTTDQTSPDVLTVQGQTKNNTVLTIQSPEIVAAPLLENGSLQQAPPSKAETILLQQIQEIIDQGKNNGTITITASATTSLQTNETHGERLQGLSNPLLNSFQANDVQAKSVLASSAVTPNENAQFTVTTLSTANSPTLAGQVNITDDSSVVSHTSTKLEGAHQDLSEQYLNAKIGESKGNEGKEFQQSNQNNNSSDQQNKTDLQAATVSTPETGLNQTKTGESAFGQQLSVSTATTTTTPGIEGKMAPGAAPHVPERDMVDNLIQRFNINPRLQTSKLSMQLHPAELGSLKIDILVQGDSIKTNIVAQSQQIMETLEKNLPRLRTILQEQGFTVDSFEVTLEGDSANQKGLFQEHFNSQQQDFSSNGSSIKGSESFESLLNPDEETDDNEEETSGVNITA